MRHPELVRGLMVTSVICYGSWPIPSGKVMRGRGDAAPASPLAQCNDTLALEKIAAVSELY
ncbi:MAG: hypothetical protein LC751_19500 [Actinobacteria bacterium]|nr:hypothetical protein [Actinomycetota bacterium]